MVKWKNRELQSRSLSAERSASHQGVLGESDIKLHWRSQFIENMDETKREVQPWKYRIPT